MNTQNAKNGLPIMHLYIPKQPSHRFPIFKFLVTSFKLGISVLNVLKTTFSSHADDLNIIGPDV